MPNQTTPNKLRIHRAGATIGQLLQRQTVDGIEYLVAPIISAREGVMNGILYLAGDLERSAAAWDGVPAPLGHPTGPDGEFVNAQADESPGVIFNSRWDSEAMALKHEVWIGIDRAVRLGGKALTLLARLNSGDVIEVSTGLLADIELAEGDYNGARYWGIARNIQPDHIAILLDEPGACSVADGCGIPRVNKETTMPDLINPASEATHRLASLLLNMELTLDERQQAALDAWWESDHLGRVMDIYSDRLVYRHNGRLWQVIYNIDEAGVAQFEPPVEMQYAPIPTEPQPQPVSNAQQPSWLDALKQFITNQFRQEATRMDRSTVIQTLLANERNVLSQETLNALSDDELAAYAAQVKPCQAAANNSQPEPAQQPEPVRQQQIDELLAEFRELKQQLAANSDREKSGLITQIIANTDIFTQAELSEKPLAEVQKLHRLTVPADYSGQGMAFANAATSEWEPYVSPIEEAQ